MCNQNTPWTEQTEHSEPSFRIELCFYPSLPWAAFLPPSDWRQFDPNSSPSDRSCPRRWSSTPAAWDQCPGSGREKERNLDTGWTRYLGEELYVLGPIGTIWIILTQHLNKQGIFSPQTFVALAIPHWRTWSPLHPCHSRVNPRKKVVQVRLEI